MMTKITLILMLCLLLTMHITSQDDQKIVYIHYDWQPYVMNNDGSNKEPFVDCPTPEIEYASDCFGMSYPDWSPNGDGFIVTNYYLDYVDAQTKEIIHLTTEEDGRILRAKWSPDGEKIAFLAYDDGQIYVMNPDGLNQIALIHGGFYGFTWIWDNNHILFVKQNGIYFDELTQSYEDAHLYLLNITDGTLVQLTNYVHQCPAGEFYAQPTWSPVSQQLVFAMGCNHDALALYMIQADSLDTLLEFDYISLSKNDDVLHETYYHDIAWSPSGEEIAFIAYIRARRAGDSRSEEIVVMNVPQTRISDTPIYQEITDTPTGIDYRYRGLTWIIP